MMESGFLLFLALVSVGSISASILPIQIGFGSEGIHTTVKGVQQCAGHEDDTVVLLEGSMPESMCMPSTQIMNMKTQINGEGSCEYELCPMIENSESLCEVLPPEQPCKCPLFATDLLDMQGVKIEIQDMGPILGEITEGDYSATANMYSAADKEKILTCIEFTFNLKKCEQE